MFKALDGTPQAAAHSRFVTEGTSHMVYKNKWPEPNGKYLPRDPKGKLLTVQDPLDGKGMVNVVLCTKGDEPSREYLFKFYPEQKEGVSLAEADLDCSDKPAGAVWIPVAATIGGEGNWGEGYTDPNHKIPDRHPNFGEGKQRYMCRTPGRAVYREMDERQQCIPGRAETGLYRLHAGLYHAGRHPRGLEGIGQRRGRRPDVLAEIPEKLGHAR